MTFPPREEAEYQLWAGWRERGGRTPGNPRPKNVRRLIPRSWFKRYRLEHPKPKPQQPPSVFSQLGGFISQAGSFPPDTESARAFQKAQGRWLAVQFGDPATDQRNRQALAQGWAERWRAVGVKVGCWWRVEHVGVPVPATPPMDLLIPNPEKQAELDRLPGILDACRKQQPTSPLAVITLGKMPGFPTGLLETHDAHLIPECFLETPKSDTNVENSVKWWLKAGVSARRLHACLLFKTGGLPQPPLAVSVAQAEALHVEGFSSFVAENTPAISWSVIA